MRLTDIYLLGIHYVLRIENKTDKACLYGTYLLARKTVYLKKKIIDGTISMEKIKQAKKPERDKSCYFG